MINTRSETHKQHTHTHTHTLALEHEYPYTHVQACYIYTHGVYARSQAGVRARTDFGTESKHCFLSELTFLKLTT